MIRYAEDRFKQFLSEQIAVFIDEYNKIDEMQISWQKSFQVIPFRGSPTKEGGSEEEGKKKKFLRKT